MRTIDDYEARKRDEDAKIANFRHLSTRAAHLALTNRALATAILSLDTNVQRYGDICSFLDKSALNRIESATGLTLSEPKDEGENAWEPEEWNGESGTVCSGKTAQGKHCTKKASYSLSGAPYCRTHYPYAPEYYEFEEARRRHWAEYFEQRDRVLAAYGELERDIRSLESMNEQLNAAMAKLGLTAKRVEVHEAKGPTSLIRVDGLTFTLEETDLGNTPGWWLHDREGYHEALIQRWSDNEYRTIPMDPNTGGVRDVNYIGSREDGVRFARLYQTFYRLRRKRDLSWYNGSIRRMIEAGNEITSTEPLRVLCQVEDAGSGWRVFRFKRGDGWVAIHSGSSEAAARWEYDRVMNADAPAAMLVDPAHQIVGQNGGSTEIW